MRCWYLAITLLHAAAQDIDAWDRVVQAHVAKGEKEGIQTHIVNYSAISADPDFTKFVSSLETAAIQNLSRNETYAIFMNAYNALAIKMVIDHACKYSLLGQCQGPISSITDIGIKVFGPASTVWMKTAGKIGGKTYSLQQIEDFLRSPLPFSEDSRLHSCIVCASISCPNVRTEAFRPEKIDEQMSDQMRDMLSNNKKGMVLDRDAKTLTLSKIFSWYAADFTKSAGSVVDFILPFITPAESQDFVAKHKQDIQLKYFDYDWHVNGKPPCQCSNDVVV
jgi:hypothetical protein